MANLIGDSAPRLTALSVGGGCASKLPAEDLERLVASLPQSAATVGLQHGDDAMVLAADASHGTRSLVLTTDFFSPMVDDPYVFGQIAAANALSDVYAMGGDPVGAINLLCWPTDTLPLALAAEVLKGGSDKCVEAEVVNSGGHTVVDPQPKFGMAVTGFVDASEMMTLAGGAVSMPITLTKGLGVGTLNNQHKITGESFPDALKSMTQLNREASVQARKAGIRAGTDITGFGLLGHLNKLLRASALGAVIEYDLVPKIDGAMESLARGFVPGGTRRNLDWVAPQVDSSLGELELLLLADAQTSGGLLLLGEIPGHPVIGETVVRGERPIQVV